MVAAQVAFDMVVVSPLVCLPLAYVCKALSTNEGGRTGSTDSISVANNNIKAIVQQQEEEEPAWSTTKFVSDLTHASIRSVRSGLTGYVHDVRYRHLLFKYWGIVDSRAKQSPLVSFPRIIE